MDPLVDSLKQFVRELDRYEAHFSASEEIIELQPLLLSHPLNVAAADLTKHYRNNKLPLVARQNFRELIRLSKQNNEYNVIECAIRDLLVWAISELETHGSKNNDQDSELLKPTPKFDWTLATIQTTQPPVSSHIGCKGGKYYLVVWNCIDSTTSCNEVSKEYAMRALSDYKDSDPAIYYRRFPDTKDAARQSKLNILFLAANPDDQARLRFGEEMRGVDKAIQSSDFRDSFNLILKPEVRLNEIQNVLMREQPHVIHFGGHGNENSELMFIGDDGLSAPYPPSALIELLRILKDNLRLVVLNACHSSLLANDIVEVIDFAIGMNDAISDNAAIEFAAALYMAIGYGRTISEAFDLGLNALRTHQIPDDNIPELFVREGIDPISTKLFS